MPSFVRLRERFLIDTQFGAPGASPALARALEHIGWRSVREPTSEELASELVELIANCVHEHRDVHALTHAIAVLFRAAGPMLDGGLPPVEAYLPAAEEVLRLYVEGGAPARPLLLDDDWPRP